MQWFQGHFDILVAMEKFPIMMTLALSDLQMKYEIYNLICSSLNENADWFAQNDAY